MKKTLLLIASVTLLVIGNTACKKNNASTGGASPITTSSTNSTYTLAANGDISGTYSGVLLEELVTLTTGTHTSVGCVFFSTPQPLKISTSVTPVTSCSVTSVYCNGVSLQYSATDSSYIDTTANGIPAPPAAWTINGNSILPSFTYTYTGAIQTYNNMAAFPDTINRNQNLVISMAGVTGYDQVEISVYDALGNSTSAYASSSFSTITISKDSLGKLAPSVNANIDIQLIKYNPQTVLSKNFLFLKIFESVKSGITLK